MSAARSNLALRDFRTLFRTGPLGDQPDGQLLGRYVERRDEAAFEALVERHGPMVFQVCRGALGDVGDAEDAFQATFLTLVRRADAIRKRESLASWLFGVAVRVSVKARARAETRRRHERGAAELATPSVADGSEEHSDPGPAVREEVARLPEKYREVVVLCYLEGHEAEPPSSWRTSRGRPPSTSAGPSVPWTSGRSSRSEGRAAGPREEGWEGFARVRLNDGRGPGR